MPVQMLATNQLLSIQFRMEYINIYIYCYNVWIFGINLGVIFYPFTLKLV